MPNPPLQPDARSDEDLVEDYLDGDVAAFRLIIERYHDELMRFLRRMMGDASAADDVFQDTFIQVHQSLETFDTTRRLKPWLFTIAANKARDALRKAKRRRTLSLSADITAGGERGSFVDLLEIDIPGPDANMQDEERSRLVQRAVDQLSPRMREILLMAYFQRLSYAQIAELLDIPLGTVKSRLHAAVAAFAKHWQQQLDAGGASESAADGA